MKKSWIRILILLIVALAVYGVKGTFTKVKDITGDAIDVVGDAAEGAADVVGDVAEGAADLVEDAADAIEEGAEELAEEVEEIIEGDDDMDEDKDEDDMNDNEDEDEDKDESEDEDDMVTVDLENSSVLWVGRSGPKQHNGIVNISAATLELDDGEVEGGSFTIDMTSIKTTDIDSEKLDDHLKAEDYFDAAGFPEATLVITDAEDNKIEADLTIKGQTFPVAFDTTVEDGKASASFSIDGTKRGVNEGGIQDALVSDTIDLDITLVY